MIPFLDNSKCLDVMESEIGAPVGQLLTPLTRYRNRARETGRPWGIDNGAFSVFRAEAWKALLHREAAGGREGCKFVCCPDVVGNARRTLELFDAWRFLIPKHLPAALVAQDGIEDLDIPWNDIDAVFIGGTTRFKVSQGAIDVARAARMLPSPKWVHVGRVNTPDRYARWEDVADSCDGSGISQYTHQRRRLLEGTPLLDALEASDV